MITQIKEKNRLQEQIVKYLRENVSARAGDIAISIGASSVRVSRALQALAVMGRARLKSKAWELTGIDKRKTMLQDDVLSLIKREPQYLANICTRLNLTRPQANAALDRLREHNEVFYNKQSKQWEVTKPT